MSPSRNHTTSRAILRRRLKSNKWLFPWSVLKRLPLKYMIRMLSILFVQLDRMDNHLPIASPVHRQTSPPHSPTGAWDSVQYLGKNSVMMADFSWEYTAPMNSNTLGCLSLFIISTWKHGREKIRSFCSIKAVSNLQLVLSRTSFLYSSNVSSLHWFPK